MTDTRPSDDRPVYLRLRDMVVAAILDGDYGDGDALPSVRSLAAAHGANPLTVAKAYQTFQDDGLIVVKRGVGMFVADGASGRLRRSERHAFLHGRWPGIAAQIKRLRIDPAELFEAELVEK